MIEREGLVEQAAARGAYLQARLHDAFDGHPVVGEVRGLGLIAGVEFVAAKEPVAAFDPAQKVGARIYRRCLEPPPFVVSEAELDEMVAIARRAVDEVAEELSEEA